MATLERPGVEIIQQITAGAPTITQPTLNPCLVGPCYAIMNPFTDEGAVNSSAEVSTPSMVKSTAKMGITVTAAAKVLAVEVNASLYVFELPASVNGSIPTSLIPETIMAKTKQTTSVEIKDEILIIKTKSVGDSATIRLHSRAELITNSVPGITADTQMAYDDLNLDGASDVQLDTTFTGQGPYTNSTYTLPYEFLPTGINHPSGKEMVFLAEDSNLYVVFDGKSRLLQKDAGIGWNALVTGATDIDDLAITGGAWPISIYKTPLYPKKKVGTTTNQVFNVGRDASVTIPLAHQATSDASANDQEPWPDAGLQYNLYAEALGSQDLVAGTSVTVGKNGGRTGNDLSILFFHQVALPGAVPVVAMNGTVLEITYQAGETTYAQLETAIAGATAAFLEFKTIKVNYPSGKGDNFLARLGADASELIGGAAGNNIWFLNGGVDPANFGVDGTHTNAKIVSSISDMDAACGLMNGKEFTISVDGAAPRAVTVASTLVLTGGNISTVFGSDLTVATDEPIRSRHAKTANAATTLSIETSSGDGADSSILLGGDSDVINELFAGYTTKTENLTGLNPAAGKVSMTLTGGTTYNTSVGTALQVAVKPGNTSVNIGGLTLLSYVASPNISANASTLTTYQVKFQHDSFIPRTGTALAEPGTSISVAENTDTVTGVGTDFTAEGFSADYVLLIDGIQVALHGTPELAAGSMKLAENWNGGTTTNALVLKTVVDGVAGGEAITPVFSPAGNSTANMVAIINTTLDRVAAAAASPAITACLQAHEVDMSAGGTDTTVAMRNVDTSSGNGFTLVSDTTNTEITNFQNSIEGTGTSSTGGFDVAQKNAAGSCLVTHAPANILLPMSATPSTVFPGPAAFSILNDDGAAISDIQTGTGIIFISFIPELHHVTGTMTADVTYTRGAANHIDVKASDYTMVVTGQATRVISGDRLFNSGSILSSVVSVNNHNVKPAQAAWGNNAMLTLATEAVDTSTSSLGAWYVYQESLATDGTGRLQPEAMFNDTIQEVTVKQGLIRSDAGIPIAGSAQMLAGYKALRKDVTAEAVTPGLLVFNDATEVETLIGPISLRNPLAFGLYLGFLNSPTSALRALGVGEVTANAPEGTVSGYMKAFDFLELHEVYAIAPLTHDTSVQQLLGAHATAMSKPLGKKERIGFICPKLPTEKLPTIATSSPKCTVEKQAAGHWHLDLGPGVNVVSKLDGLKDAGGNAISASTSSSHTAKQGIFITRTGDPYRYVVDKIVNSHTIRFRTNLTFDSDKGPGSGGNDDGYYKNDPISPAVIDGDLALNFSAAGELCTLQVRNVAVDGSTTAGKLTQCEILAEIAGGPSGYQNRRLILVQPQQCTTLFDGLETVIPGYYLCGAIAAMVGQYNPSQPFTNFPMVGFIRPLGSSDLFTENQMATAASGGIYWVIQDVTGAPLVSRHQLTTDLTSVKTRELSVTKAIDYVAKQLRQAVRRFIGRNNITQGLLDQISLVLAGNLKSLTGNIVNTAKLDSLIVDTSAPDKIAVQITVVPFFPANKITITIVV